MCFLSANPHARLSACKTSKVTHYIIYVYMYVYITLTPPRAAGNYPRRCAEKSVRLMSNLLLRFTQPGDKVLDLFAGTAALGLAAIMHSRTYTGVDEDDNVVEPAMARLGRMCITMQKYDQLQHFTSSLTGGLVRMASAPFTCPVIGTDNVPAQVAGTVKQELQRTHGDIIEIKETSTKGVGGKDMGEGLFATTKVPKGTQLGCKRTHTHAITRHAHTHTHAYTHTHTHTHTHTQTHAYTLSQSKTHRFTQNRC